jgi:hypothetical protein
VFSASADHFTGVDEAHRHFHEGVVLPSDVEDDLTVDHCGVLEESDGFLPRPLGREVLDGDPLADV